MNTFHKLQITAARAICYSGFRAGQHPGGVYPTYSQVKEDLLLLHQHWKYIRLYSCDQHAETVLQVIHDEKLNLKVMLGAFLDAEMNNFNCPWNGGVSSELQLKKNGVANRSEIRKLIELGNRYPDIIFALSVGNEACVDWTDHFVPERKMIQYVKQVKEKTTQPVTCCDNYVPWLFKLDKLAAVVDFISIHTYPVWEYKHIHEALDYTRDNYHAVSRKFPDKAVVITEAGWATQSNGKGIDPGNVNEEYQKIYFEDLMEWSEKDNILTFFFEAFDEEWKGSPEPLEPEKHWGLYNIDRIPKQAVRNLNTF